MSSPKTPLTAALRDADNRSSHGRQKVLLRALVGWSVSNGSAELSGHPICLVGDSVAAPFIHLHSGWHFVFAAPAWTTEGVGPVARAM